MFDYCFQIPSLCGVSMAARFLLNGRESALPMAGRAEESMKIRQGRYLEPGRAIERKIIGYGNFSAAEHNILPAKGNFLLFSSTLSLKRG